MAPTLGQFGHGTMVQNGRPALGTRPYMVVLAEYSDQDPFTVSHPIAYYQQLSSGAPAAPFTTVPVKPASLREFFRENSHGRFSFEPLAVVGPIAMGPYDTSLGGKPEVRLQRILDAVPDQLFDRLDVNLNDAISSDELCVVVFENLAGLQPANRDNDPVVVRLFSPAAFPLMFVNKVLQVHVAGAGPKTPFFQIAHELSHSLGTVDLYGTGNSMLTIMGGYSFFADDQATVHLDAWHKLKLGWIEPRMFDLAAPGSAVVHTGADGALVLWDGNKLAREYFIVERRRPAAADVQYDWNVSGDGVLIWHVGGSPDQIYHLGATAAVPGGSGVWTAGTQTPLLRWSDGRRIARSILITADGDGALRANWVDRGIELTVSTESIDVGTSIFRQETDGCGNVLKFGTWPLMTVTTFGVAETLGLAQPAFTWTLQGAPIAPGRAVLTVDAGSRRVRIDCELAPDGRSLTLRSEAGDGYEALVGITATDRAGQSAHADYLFTATASYTGMRWEDIATAAQCIADSVPVTVDVGGFTLPWEKRPGVDFRPIPLEWPGWKVEEWAREARARLQTAPDLDATSRGAISRLIDLQVTTPKFRVAAQDLALKLKRPG